MHMIELARGVPPAGVLFVVNRNDEEVYWERKIYGHHANELPFVQSVEPGTPCFVYRIHTKVSSPRWNVLMLSQTHVLSSFCPQCMLFPCVTAPCCSSTTSVILVESISSGH